MRAASTLEQIAASSWKEAIDEAVQLAVQDITASGLQARGGAGVPDVDAGNGTGLDSAARPVERLDLAPQDLPPVAPQEVVASLQGAAVGNDSVIPRGVTSILSSRRVSAYLESVLPALPFRSSLAKVEQDLRPGFRM